MLNVECSLLHSEFAIRNSNFIQYSTSVHAFVLATFFAGRFTRRSTNEKGRQAAVLSLRGKRVSVLDRDDVGGLEAFGALDQVELDRRTLGKRAKALSLDRREVDEDILAAFHSD